MGRDTNQDWSILADKEAYWGVLSIDDYKSDTMTPEAKAEFFKSGEQLVNDILGYVKSRIEPDFNPVRALDFGCGVGRLTLPLALKATEVVGVDVAERMLELCAENASEAGIKNVSVVLGDDELSQVSGTFNFIVSDIVLQHVDPNRGMQIIGKLLEIMDVGGVASLQLTYGKQRKFWKHESGRAQFYRREGSAIIDLVDNPDRREPGSITMYDYDLNKVFALMSLYCGDSIFVVPTNDDGHLGVRLLFMKTKEGTA